MNTKYFIFIFLFAILLALPVFGEDFTGSLRYENYTTTYNTGMVSGAASYAQLQQSFRIGETGTNVTFNITGFQLPIYNELAIASCDVGDKFSVTLFSTNASGYFEGDALSENLTVACKNMPDNTGNYMNITMPIYELEAGTQYAIVVWNYLSDADMSIYWQGDAPGTYTGGISGRNWTGNYDSFGKDMGFEVWGVEVGISVTLVFPEENGVVSDIGENFTTNVSSGTNLDNITYFVWNSTSRIFNQTTVDITGTKNDTRLYIDNFTLGTYSWNAWACNFNNNCAFAISNFTLTIGATIDDQNYSNVTYETDYQSFQINISLIEGTNLHRGELFYNKTNYEGTLTSLGNDKYFLSKSIDIPTINDSNVAENFTFHWRLTYEKEDGTFIYENLTSYNQTVDRLLLGNCTATLEIKTLNFTAWDEEEPATRINDFDFKGTFNYWLGKGTQYKSISIDSPAFDEQNLCINLGNSTYYSNATIQYEKIGYVKRSYYLINSSLTNITNEIDLFLLNTSSSTSFLINIIDSVQSVVSNAYVYIQRYYPGTGTYETVEMSVTDDSGNAVGHFEDETEDYRTIIIQDGVVVYESDTQKVYCSSTPCTLSFQIEAGAPTAWRNVGDVSNLVWTLNYNTTTKIWKYTYVDTSGTTNYGRLLVYTKDGGGKNIICNKSDTGNAATLTCNVTGYDGTIYAEVYISRSPEILIWLESIVEKVMKGILGLEGLFWAAFILLIIGLIGIWNPAIGVVMTMAGMVVINFLQLASFGVVTIAGVIIIGVILLWGMKKGS